ncbi:acetyltransferase [Compostibacter hankyongensis]|uniref:Acetyltransferase n=1 Tax=Compostibacter hankyongensis TaxID=1007089 RepID=A0ABP8FV09_9BACT
MDQYHKNSKKKMLNAEVCLYGAGGHAKVVIDVLKSTNKKIIGLIDDNVSNSSLWGYPIYRSIKDLRSTIDYSLIISIGNNQVRKRIAENLTGLFFINAAHISAALSDSCIVKEGTVIMPNVSVNADAKIGRHVILNTNSSIDHDCIIEDFVHLSPNVALSGKVYVGEGTHIGTGASVIPEVKIGRWTTIGAGTVIIRDIPDYAIVVGNPGKIINFSKPNTSQ